MQLMALVMAAIFLLTDLISVDAITSTYPCDPMINNVSVDYLFESNIALKVARELHIDPSWYIEPMWYVNCSFRGLDKIPLEIPWKVQILDLSSNVIFQVRKEDLEKFKDLQVLWLYSNCLGNLSNIHYYCTKVGAYEYGAFGWLTTLKALNIGDNSFPKIPRDLPDTLEYLNVSQNCISKIEASDLNNLKNLIVFDASNIDYCVSVASKHPLRIDNDSFEGLSIKILQLSENRRIFEYLTCLNLNTLLYVDFAQTRGVVLSPKLMQNMSSVKRLDLYLQNPNKRTRFKVLNHTFDTLIDLEYLDLSSNMIEFLHDNLFQHNLKLSHLDISGNCLVYTVVNPTYVPHQIKYLYLGYNNCKHGMPSTNKNDSISNGIEIIQNSFIFGPSFLHMSNLTILSYGKPSNLGKASQISIQTGFQDISNRTIFNLLHLKNLSNLVLSDSSIQHLDLSTINSFENLKYLDLSNNMIMNISVSKQHFSAELPKVTENYCNDKVKLILAFNKVGMTLTYHILVLPKCTWLELQFNLISTIRDNAFKNMPCLSHIDLTNNPIVYIHTKSFEKLLYLKVLHISSMSLIRYVTSFFFLKYLSNSTLLHLSLLHNNLFVKLSRSRFLIRSIKSIDLSNNQIVLRYYLKKSLKTFPNLNNLSLKQCKFKFSDFVFPNPFLIYLDLSQNELQQITSTLLRSVSLLKSLILSRNKITQFEFDLLDLVPYLESLDLSYNYISVITINKTTSNGLFKNLKILNLQHNYIYELSEEIFTFSFLSRLEFLDLRWNSIKCYCKMTSNFGRWLSQASFTFRDRPGFLPRCSSSVQRFGGCVTCAANIKVHNANVQPLLLFATTNLCLVTYNVLLTAIFTSFFVIFTSVSSFLFSSKGMFLLAKFSTRKVRSVNSADEEQKLLDTFAIHAFVLFDSESITVGNWIDDLLVPQLTQNPPYLKIEVMGRDDQCGFTPVSQHLLKVEASRKVILVLTGNYWQSARGKYLLSAIENLCYETGHDRALIVTFENDLQIGGMLRKLRKNNPWSTLQYPNDPRYSAIFWQCLRNSLT